MVRVSVSTLSPLDDNRWSYHVEVTESDGSGSQTRHKVNMDRDIMKKFRSELSYLLISSPQYCTGKNRDTKAYPFSFIPSVTVCQPISAISSCIFFITT